MDIDSRDIHRPILTYIHIYFKNLSYYIINNVIRLNINTYTPPKHPITYSQVSQQQITVARRNKDINRKLAVFDFIGANSKNGLYHTSVALKTSERAVYSAARPPQRWFSISFLWNLISVTL